MIPAAQPQIRLLPGIVHEFHILAHLLPRRAVISLAEFIHQFPGIKLRIPHQMRRHPHPKRQHVPGQIIVIIPFLKHAHDTVLGKEFQILSKRVKIRMRNQIIRERRRVIPDEQIRRHLRPPAQIIPKPRVRRPGQRMRKVALDRTKPHDHMLRRPSHLRRRPRVLIRQRLYEEIRILLCDVLRALVHEPNPRALTLCALFRDDLLTFIALARPECVVLRNRDHPGRRILLDPPQRIFHQLLSHLLVA